ncbi:MAG: dihydroorotase [Oscillatoriales cyanobacterium]|nr:MAG: dihydroorotase [Oscillatoriales cyanobacterium]
MTIDLLRNIRLIDPVAGIDRVATVLLDRGRVVAIDPEPFEIPDGATVIQAEGQILGPGLVDLYSRSGEPGYETRGTLAQLAAAAIAGGFTQVALLPTTEPALDRPAMVKDLRDRWVTLNGPKPRLHLWGALTQNAAGQQMAELAALAAAGIVGFADGRAIGDPVLEQRLLDYGGALGLPIALYARSRVLAAGGSVLEGAEALRLGLVGAPPAAESSAIATVLEWLDERSAPVHFMRLGAARSLPMVAAARERGWPVTASVSWLHLLCDGTHIDGRRPLPGSDRPASPYDPSLHLQPPLGNPTDRLALVAALRSGTIDAIAIDHAPYTYEEKTVAFAEAPTGAIGLELALPLLWSVLVAGGELRALDLWRALSQRPAELLGHPLRAIEPGSHQPLIRFDPERLWTVEPSQLHTTALNSPWLGHTVRGRVVQVWL